MTPEQYVARLRDDHRFFLEQLWKDRGLDKVAPLSEVELDIWDWLIKGPQQRITIAHRSIGKTYLICAAVCYGLYREVNDKHLVISKSGKHAKGVIQLIREWIRLVPFLKHMDPANDPNQTDTTTEFSVAGCKEDKVESVTSKGIDGQITGGRAAKVWFDDVETPENTKTPDAREDLDNKVKEAKAIATYGSKEIIYVGTYHTEESLYNKLSGRGYICRSWPLVYPAPDDKVTNLAPLLQRRLDAGTHQPGQIVTNHRFTEQDRAQFEAEGRTWYAMQYRLIADMGDTNRYPLQLRDLIVFTANKDKAPISIAWGTTNDKGGGTRIDDIPAYGFAGDALYGPIMFDNDWAAYSQTRMWIDPSGRGEDRTAYAIVSYLNSYLWAHEVKGIIGGYGPEVLHELAQAAQNYRVQQIDVEDVAMSGMMVPLMEPILHSYFIEPGSIDCPDGWRCSIEPNKEWARGQKETRILAALEPVTGQHRLVVSRAVAANERLQTQYTRLTRQRNSLPHEDELETLAAAVALYQDRLHVDPARAAQRVRDEQVEKTSGDTAKWPQNEPDWDGRPRRRTGGFRTDGARIESY